MAGAAVEVVRNDALSVPAVLRQGLSGLVISPGPGQPSQAGSRQPCWPRCWRAPRLASPGRVPGPSDAGEGFGARVERASRPIHGKIWQIRRAPPPPDPADDDPLWQGLPPLLAATRYHSLVVAPTSLPLPAGQRLERRHPDEPADEPVIMALQHVERPLFGLQFHPESIGCPLGPVCWKTSSPSAAKATTSDGNKQINGARQGGSE